jgi:PTS system beta-glucosides-specific IIC component
VAGVTEPAIYGVTLRLRRPFFYACIGGMVGGGIAAAGGSAADSFVFPGLITLPAYMHVGNFTFQLVGTATAVAIAFVLTLVLGFEDIPNPTSGAADAPEPVAADVTVTPAAMPGPPAHRPPTPSVPTPRVPPLAAPTPDLPPSGVPEVITVAAPLAGYLLPLSEVPDPVFARGLMGSGVAIRPTKGVLRSPVNGTITSVARARHAVGVRSDEGVELLLHLGIDTVHLGGRYFETLVTPGQRVQVGAPMVLVDLEALAAAGYEAATPIVVTNSAAFASVEVLAEGQVAAGEPLLRVTTT